MLNELISVTEAKELIKKHTKALEPIWLNLEYATALVLAEDIFSKTDIPAFNQSSMDGYAINYEDWQKHKELIIDGESQAGIADLKALTPGCARRIFTGAALPLGADTIIIQEKVELIDGKLIIQDPQIIKGQHVRLKGSEAKADELAIEKNTFLSPPAIGFIASLGINQVLAYPQPSMSVILTGNELLEPGKKMQIGQVYDSNSFALKAALGQIGIKNVNIFYSEDNLETLSSVLKTAITQSDLVLLTGGISVGDYDFVLSATQQNGVEQIFHKIKQKPGKPLFFGKKGNKYIFGLPGNPASVMTCFYEYVYPAIGILNNSRRDLVSIQAPISHAQKKTLGLTQFLKGYFDGKIAHDLKAQESFRLSSFAHANCLIVLDQNKSEITENELVEIHLLAF